MDTIIEQIIEKIEDETKYKNIKINDLFHLIDKHIDEWDIDIDDFYLDDVVENVSHIIKKRNNLNVNNNKEDDIIFKLDEETLEKNQLDSVIKQYDKLYKKACKINIETEISCSIDSDSGIQSSSWNDTLNRIDNIYKKIDE